MQSLCYQNGALGRTRTSRTRLGGVGFILLSDKGSRLVYVQGNAFSNEGFILVVNGLIRKGYKGYSLDKLRW